MMLLVWVRLLKPELLGFMPSDNQTRGIVTLKNSTLPSIVIETEYLNVETGSKQAPALSTPKS